MFQITLNEQKRPQNLKLQQSSKVEEEGGLSHQEQIRRPRIVKSVIKKTESNDVYNKAI